MQRNFTKGCVQRCLMAVPLLLLLSFSYAQKSAQPGRNVTLNNNNISLREVFNIIEKQTGVVLFFMDINTSQQVGVHVANTPVEEVLAEVLNPLGLTYEYVKGNRDKIFVKSVGGTRIVKKDTAQVVVVSGVVTDEKGEPLPGASVRVKGTQYGTATNPNGSFTLAKASLDDVLQISYTGFVMQEMALNGRTKVSVTLKHGDNSLNETVVTAYGTSTQRAFTGAITVVKGGEIQNLPNRSFDKSLQGLVPGLFVTSGTGQPGGGVSNFVLRGIATSADPINGSTVRNPLIIIDGIPISQETAQLGNAQNAHTTAINNPLAQLNPSDIETLSVLKDAAAIALYGAKASNGVILITTKRGKSGKIHFNFRHQTDISSAINKAPAILNQKEYLNLLYETYRNTDSIKWTDRAILSDLYTKFPYRVIGRDTSFYPSPNWERELFNNTATTMANELSMSGGNEQNIFYLNLEYTNQDGVIRKTGYDRKSVRFNFENNAYSWLKVGLNSTISYNVQDYGGSIRGGGNMSAPEIKLMSPLNPIRLENGEYVLNYKYGAGTRNAVNPAAAARYNISRNSAFRGLTKLYADIGITKYLRFNPSFGVDFMLAESKEKIDPRLTDPATGSIGGRIEEQDIRRGNIITTNVLRYNREFLLKHNVGIVVGQEAQIISQKNLGIAVGNLSLSYYDQINSPGVSVLRQNGSFLKETLLSYFGQLNYAYSNKYFLTGSIRKDGSSRFGADQRFGIYWSTGLGCILVSESEANRKMFWLNYLKVRGSIGAAGNAGAIDRFTPYDQVGYVKYIGNTAVYTSTLGNPDIKWENTFSWDAGVEARLIKNRVIFTGDIYQRNTSNLIYSVNQPLNTGFSSILANIGNMRNRGVELSVSIDIINRNNFRWNFNANWSTNKNVLTKANVPIASTVIGPLANKEGKNFNSFYTFLWAGVNPVNGNSQWIDSTGKVSENYSAAKKHFLGKPQPDGFGMITNNLSFKGIALSLQFYYQYGYMIYNYNRFINDGSDPYRNQSIAALDRWQKPGDISPNPRRVLSNPNGGTSRGSSRLLNHGDHIRFQNIVISYDFPRISMQRLHLEALRIFIQGNNLALWSLHDSGDVDPGATNAAGYSNTAYPLQKTFSIGLNMQF